MKGFIAYLLIALTIVVWTDSLTAQTDSRTSHFVLELDDSLLRELQSRQELNSLLPRGRSFDKVVIRYAQDINRNSITPNIFNPAARPNLDTDQLNSLKFSLTNTMIGQMKAGGVLESPIDPKAEIGLIKLFFKPDSSGNPASEDTRFNQKPANQVPSIQSNQGNRPNPFGDDLPGANGSQQAGGGSFAGGNPGGFPNSNPTNPSNMQPVSPRGENSINNVPPAIPPGNSSFQNTNSGSPGYNAQTPSTMNLLPRNNGDRNLAGTPQAGTPQAARPGFQNNNFNRGFNERGQINNPMGSPAAQISQQGAPTLPAGHQIPPMSGNPTAPFGAGQPQANLNGFSTNNPVGRFQSPRIADQRLPQNDLVGNRENMELARLRNENQLMKQNLVSLNKVVSKIADENDPPETKASKSLDSKEKPQTPVAEGNGAVSTILWFLFFCSMGLNLYLFFIWRSSYSRYQDLADDLRQTFSQSSD